MDEMAEPSDLRTDVLADGERGFPRASSILVRGLRRVRAILDPRSNVICVAASPRVIGLRIWARGKPLLGLPGLPQGSLESASKIIVLRLDRLGDAVLFSSFLRDLRMSVSTAQIHLVCSPAAFPAYKNCPHVNRVQVFDYGEAIFSALSRRSAVDHWRLCKAARDFARRHLEPFHADVLLAPRFDVDGYGATYLAAFSRARLSVSYSERCTDIRQRVNRGHDKLWSVVIPGSGIEHEVLRNAAFLEQIGLVPLPPVLEFWATAEERETADAFLARHGCGERPVILAPGANELCRQWPAERFAFVARVLEDAGKDVVLVGSASDAPLCSSIARRLRSARVWDASGQLNFGSLFCLLERSSVFVGNDSGPAHLAAAAGIPVVVISGHPRSGRNDYHQSPRRFGPWGVPNRVLQPQRPIPPCTDHCSASAAHCIEQVSENEVVEAALKFVSDRGRVFTPR